MKRIVAMGGLAVACMSSVQAQTTTANTDGDITEVVVTGIRLANDVAIEAKRNSTNIIDVIGSSEVRALPDTTVVESLRRIPGLSILPQTDNEHPQDEAITPVIRGLGAAYNNVTIDGLPVASPGTPNGVLGSIQRGVRLDILPTSMISQLQVVKSFTADLDPNAVGGAVNVVTRSAFEGGGEPFFTVDAALGHASDVGEPRDQDDPGYRFIATGSTTFGPDDMFGMTLAANYQTMSSFTEENATSDTIYYNFYDDAGNLQRGAALGNGIPVPQEDRYWYAQNDRRRYGVIDKLEVRLSEQFDAYVSGGYYYFKDHYQRNELYITARPYQTVQNQTPTSGTYQQGLIQVGFIDDNTVSKTRVLQTGMNWRPADRQVVSLRGSWSRATYDERYPMLKYGTGVRQAAPGTGGTTQVPTNEFGFNYETSGLRYRFPVQSAEYYDLSNYSLIYYRPFIHRQAKDRIVTGRLDYNFNRSSDDRGLGFALGVSHTDDRPSYSIDRLDYQPNTSAAPLTLDGALGPTGASMQYSNGLYLLTIDPQRALEQINALPGSAFNQTNQTVFNNQDNFTHQEKTLGTYALMSFRNDAVAAEAGVHFDKTRQSTVGRLLKGGAFEDAPTSSDYSYVLPSAIATWHVTPEWDVRGAVSQTIGRPSYDSYAARSSVAFANTADEGNPNATGVVVTIGNPDLKPRRSTNVDVALDWLLSSEYGGLISLSAFYKDIDDEIFNASSLGYSYQNVNYVNAVVTKPVNSSSATIQGLEFNATINSLGFVNPLLSGFGASTNVAWLDGSIEVPLSAGGTRTIDNLVGQPDYTINSSIFYVEKGFEVRAAFNRQGRALRSILNDIAWQDLYWAPRSQLDLSASYSFDNGLSFFAQASNVTRSQVLSLTGPEKDLLRNSYTVPTTYWFGVRFTPRLD